MPTAKYARLTAAQDQPLPQIENNPLLREKVRLRAKVISLSHRGMRATAIAEHPGRHYRSLRRDLECWEKQQRLREKLAEGVNDTAGDLAAGLRQQFGGRANRENVRLCLKEMGYGWRPRGEPLRVPKHCKHWGSAGRIDLIGSLSFAEQQEQLAYRLLEGSCKASAVVRHLATLAQEAHARGKLTVVVLDHAGIEPSFCNSSGLSGKHNTSTCVIYRLTRRSSIPARSSGARSKAFGCKGARRPAKQSSSRPYSQPLRLGELQRYDKIMLEILSTFCSLGAL